MSDASAKEDLRRALQAALLREKDRWEALVGWRKAYVDRLLSDTRAGRPEGTRRAQSLLRLLEEAEAEWRRAGLASKTIVAAIDGDLER